MVRDISALWTIGLVVVYTVRCCDDQPPGTECQSYWHLNPPPPLKGKIVVCGIEYSLTTSEWWRFDQLVRQR